MAEVEILINGYFKNISQNRCRASSTITLIRSGGENILVDTGNYRDEQKIIKALKSRQLTPEKIDKVIFTRQHQLRLFIH